MQYRQVKGIDVSENNGDVNWKAVADAGMEFAIVRSSYGLYSKDENFLKNVNGAHEHGLICGAYHYGYGLDPQAAVQEAVNCRQTIDEAGVLLELPVFYDLEDADGYKRDHGFSFTRDVCTDICRKFIKHLGLKCGVYASYSWFEEYIDWQALGCPVWNAQWGKVDDLGGMLWQYTATLDIGGREFDGNIYYKPEPEE